MARRKKKLSPIYVISLGAHLAVGAALALVPQKKLREVVAIALNEPPKKEEQKEPPKPPEHTAARPTRAPSAHAHAEPVPEAAPAADPSSQPTFHDLGLMLDSSSSDGIAVRLASTAPLPIPQMAPPKPKLLAPRKLESDCDGPLQKARPIALVRPAYTDEARRAHVQGRVRIELAVDDRGQVTDAHVLDGLGYGLDEAALAAARKLRFEPALRCSRKVSAPFVISMRFLLGT